MGYLHPELGGLEPGPNQLRCGWIECAEYCDEWHRQGGAWVRVQHGGDVINQDRRSMGSEEKLRWGARGANQGVS